ncbi:deferrochelatase/peroxidase EfeB [Kitasatospora gansuensis]|uniref:Deferrochelatase/peroxidase EfeB n=1 Tax=Kitasatospora gansuensis TaxID=258050 RepID=A0A7W7SGQ3_9ACTN|nr:Dyp-type peroxidase [Kitasatospora gansuensis]MBB4950140.1 deferrochelatase/peroxidase EfeB [Kitasatospora gansuensis]
MTDQTCPAGFGRRSFVKATALASGALALRAGTTPAAARTGRPRAVIPFHGPHQAGIVTPAQGYASFVSLAVTVPDRAELAKLLRELTARIRFLTAGGTPPADVPGSPPNDSGTLGPVVPADGLTVTVGAGATLFDRRYGLAGVQPVRLSQMRAFRGDRLRAGELHGDLSLQLCADSRDVVSHALRDLGRRTRGRLQPVWRIDGQLNPARPDGAQRNVMGFKDGIANPDPTSARELDRLVWVQPGGGEPAWAEGGSYQVLRTVRVLCEAWEDVPLDRQERLIGRRRDSGAPLDGTTETDLPDYAKDPTGAVTPLDSHIRLANPRTPETDDSRVLRRGYSYDRGLDGDGRLDAGLAFCCYQQDLVRQFEAVQRRLEGEPLGDFLVCTGGGYFFALPGVKDEEDWLGRGMLSG